MELMDCRESSSIRLAVTTVSGRRRVSADWSRGVVAADQSETVRTMQVAVCGNLGERVRMQTGSGWCMPGTVSTGAREDKVFEKACSRYLDRDQVLISC